MQTYDGWEPLSDDNDPQHEKMLGKGGQGEVFLARSPERVTKRRQAEEQARKILQQDMRYTDFAPAPLAKYLMELGAPEAAEKLGALKKFKIPTDNKDEESRAIGRLESEAKALQALRDQPGVLKLLHANVAGRFIVTEYHENGTLDKHLDMFKSNALGALNAFLPLVDAVCKIHEEGAIHRDIKTENIFVTASGNLVLGDFGIVFLQDGSDRLTTTYERVGSHEWMAPWAYKREKLELSKISPALDIFPLTKVLWSMISGQNGFAFWEYDLDENNLEKLFPDDPIMALVNDRIFSKRIVRHEKECDSSAQNLRAQVEGLINYAKDIRGFRRDGVEVWPCKICGKGKYKNSGPRYQIKGYREGGPILLQNQSFYVSVCDHCGHAELFTR
jgi:serine/threonine protein kinase